MENISGKVIDYVRDQYGIEPDSPWDRYPENMVLRHQGSGKWFALIFEAGYGKISPEDFPGDRRTAPILNLKCDPLIASSIRENIKGVYRGYHMNHEQWITVLLDGTVGTDEIAPLIDMSYQLTKPGASRRKSNLKTDMPEDYIIPANPKMYDIDKAFESDPDLYWHQRINVKVGDRVFIYMTSPIAAIRYCCVVKETDVEVEGEEGRHMKLHMVKRYPDDVFTLDVMRENGMGPVRGARRVNYSLACLLREY